MAKTRRGTPPLFELLENNHLRRGSTAPDLRLVRPDSEPEEIELVAPPQPRFNDPDAIVEKPGKATAIQLLGDRLHLSLTPFSAAIGVFVISFLVFAALFFGQKRGAKTAIDRSAAGILAGAPIEGVEAVREQPPATHLVESLLVSQAAPASAGPSEAPRKLANANPAPVSHPAASPRRDWLRDHTYIVAQEFAAGREADAKKAQDYLLAKGFPAKVVKFDSGTLQLITVEGYDHKDPAQKKKADEILKKQRAAGAEYWAAGGGYRLEGYFKTLKKDEW